MISRSGNSATSLGFRVLTLPFCLLKIVSGATRLLQRGLKRGGILISESAQRGISDLIMMISSKRVKSLMPSTMVGKLGVGSEAHQLGKSRRMLMGCSTREFIPSRSTTITNNENQGKLGKKNNKNSETHNNNNSNNNGGFKSSGDKRFKTLPPFESLPRSEPVGGYIFVCNNDTMQENLKRQLFGLPPRYRDSVRAIRPGLPRFLYNYSTHQLHGIFEASSFGGTNIDPTAWEDKKCRRESRFPAQVRVVLRKICEPLEEDSFRPVLHHYDGPKFRLELSVSEALALLDIFADNHTL